MWRAATGTGIWSMVIKDKYMYGQYFIAWIFGGAKRKTISSYLWKSMMKDTLAKAICSLGGRGWFQNQYWFGCYKMYSGKPLITLPNSSIPT